MNRRAITLTAAGIIAALALIWGFQKWLYARAHESTDNAQVDGQLSRSSVLPS